MNNNKKNFGYVMGQIFFGIVVLCLAAIVIGVTVAVLGRIL